MSRENLRCYYFRMSFHPKTGYSEHYTKVVRAFYFEALELMEFLSKISTANESLKSLNSDPLESEVQEIDALRRKQWSSAWGEVVFSFANILKTRR